MKKETATTAQTRTAAVAAAPAIAPPGQRGGRRGHGFGTAPVFLASVSTILGAVMFLRFGYAVGHAGLLGALAIIMLGHPDWRRAEISVFAAYPQAEEPERRRRLKEMILSGRIPVTGKNIEIIPTDDRVDFNRLVEARSSSADLTVFGFTDGRLRAKGPALFLRHPALRDVLFVSEQQQILIE